MIDNFARCLGAVLLHEGGYVNDPQDTGGATNLGVTQSSLGDWLGRAATIDEVKALTPESVSGLYRQNFWMPPGCDPLPSGLDYMVFDASVQHGPARAARMLQDAAGVAIDGQVGPATLAAVRAAGAKALVFKMSSIREAFYRNQPNFPHFGNGWMNRLRDVTQQSAAWV